MGIIIDILNKKSFVTGLVGSVLAVPVFLFCQSLATVGNVAWVMVLPPLISGVIAGYLRGTGGTAGARAGVVSSLLVIFSAVLLFPGGIFSISSDAIQVSILYLQEGDLLSSGRSADYGASTLTAGMILARTLYPTILFCVTFGPLAGYLGGETKVAREISS